MMKWNGAHRLEPMTAASLKLPLVFDPAGLQSDLQAILAEEFSDSVTRLGVATRRIAEHRYFEIRVFGKDVLQASILIAFHLAGKNHLLTTCRDLHRMKRQADCPDDKGDNSSIGYLHDCFAT